MPKINIPEHSSFKHVAHTSNDPLGMEAGYAEGNYIFDIHGKKYLDLISGIGVNVLGHRHPAIISEIDMQLGKYLHVMVYGELIIKPQVEYADLITGYLPPDLNTVFFVNSGSEAVEGALKLAKRYTGRTEIVAFRNAYHGSTMGALSVCGNEKYIKSFKPLIPGVVFFDLNNINEIDKITKKTACVIIEPIQGEAGVFESGEYFLKSLREKCYQTGTLLVFDEIQTGMGRTGKLYTFEHFNIVPDILLTGKAFGGGLPLAAFIANNKIMDSLKTNPALGHITTSGGNPLCCAAGKACLETLLKSGLIEQAYEKGNLFKKLLIHNEIKKIRGKGLLLAVDLGDENKTKNLIRKCLDSGIILDWFLFNPESIRIAPPLTISTDEIHFACQTIKENLD